MFLIFINILPWIAWHFTQSSLKYHQTVLQFSHNCLIIVLERMSNQTASNVLSFTALLLSPDFAEHSFLGVLQGTKHDPSRYWILPRLVLGVFWAKWPLLVTPPPFLPKICGLKQGVTFSLSNIFVKKNDTKEYSNIFVLEKQYERISEYIRIKIILRIWYERIFALENIQICLNIPIIVKLEAKLLFWRKILFGNIIPSNTRNNLTKNSCNVSFAFYCLKYIWSQN